MCIKESTDVITMNKFIWALFTIRKLANLLVRYVLRLNGYNYWFIWWAERPGMTLVIRRSLAGKVINVHSVGLGCFDYREICE